QPINPVVLPEKEHIVVYLLAGTNKPNVVVIGKHYRVLVSADGKTVEEVTPRSKSVIELSTEAQGPDKVAALITSQIVTDYPLETHVFASLSNRRIPIYISTTRGLWS